MDGLSSVGQKWRMFFSPINPFDEFGYHFKCISMFFYVFEEIPMGVFLKYD